MKRHLQLTIPCLIVLCAGCGEDRLFKEKTSDINNIRLELITGSVDKLIERGEINYAERVEMPDGVKIAAWVTTHEKGEAAGTAVILHGTGESKANYLSVAKELSKRGFDVVLIDLRMHGESGGDYITCGAKEKMDVQRILDLFSKKNKIAGDPVYLLGCTFGAAVAIQYAAIEPDTAGVIAVAPWKDAASKARRDLGLIIDEDEFQNMLNRAADRAGFDPRTTSAVLSAPKVTCPVYIIHGMGDLAVPVSDSREIYSHLGGPKKLKLVTPLIEQSIVGIGWDKWICDQLDEIVSGAIK